MVVVVVVVFCWGNGLCFFGHLKVCLCMLTPCAGEEMHSVGCASSTSDFETTGSESDA